MEALEKNTQWKGRRGPVVLVIMDGVGFGKYCEGDAVADSRMPCLRELLATQPNTRLKAHGTAVGLPSDKDMGNSEVGHNAMGCGRVFEQGAALVSAAIKSGKIFENQTWLDLKKVCSRAYFDASLDRAFIRRQCSFAHRTLESAHRKSGSGRDSAYFCAHAFRRTRRTGNVRT